MKTRVIDTEHTKGRVDFVGNVVPDEIRDKYIRKSVAKLEGKQADRNVCTHN